MKAVSVMTCVLVLCASSALATHGGDDHRSDSAEMQQAIQNAACEDTTRIKVNGLVCDFCARALEKVFGRREEVAGINVNLDDGVITIATKSGQSIDDDTMKSLIADSGYNVTSIEKGCTS